MQSGSSPYHLQRPHPSDPHLQLALNPPDIVELDAFPPASASRFPPEEQQLLGHSDSVTIGKIVALDVGPKTCERDAADDCLVRLTSAVTPLIVVIEAADAD